MAHKLLAGKSFIYSVVSAEPEQECDDIEDSDYFISMPLWYKDCGFNSVVPNLWETEYDDANIRTLTLKEER